MKVCHLISGDLWAGAEAQVTILLEGLSHHDKVDVYAVVYNKGLLANKLRQLNLKLFIIEEDKNNFAKLLWKTHRILKDLRIDIIHSHRYKENLIAVLVSLVNNIPAVIRTEHGLREPFYGFKELKIRFYYFIDRLLAKYFTNKIIAVSSSIENHLSKKIERQRIITIHNAVAIKKINVNQCMRRKLSIPADSSVIGIAGRLVPIKGIDYFLRAGQIISDQFKNVDFIVIGDGPLKPQLISLAKRLGIEQHVRFTGFVRNFIEHLSIIDIFVLASHSEGLPLALLQAMAMSKAIVATNVGGIPEVIKHNVNGLLVAPKSEHGLASACLHLLKQPLYAQKMGQKAQWIIKHKFSPANMVRQVMSIYEDFAVK